MLPPIRCGGNGRSPDCARDRRAATTRTAKKVPTTARRGMARMVAPFDNTERTGPCRSSIGRRRRETLPLQHASRLCQRRLTRVDDEPAVHEHEVEPFAVLIRLEIGGF